jgi:hypothetical protein
MNKHPSCSRSRIFNQSRVKNIHASIFHRSRTGLAQEQGQGSRTYLDLVVGSGGVGGAPGGAIHHVAGSRGVRGAPGRVWHLVSGARGGGAPEGGSHHAAGFAAGGAPGGAAHLVA